MNARRFRRLAAVAVLLLGGYPTTASPSVSAPDAPGPVVGAGQAGRVMMAAELDKFVVNYYRHPRPELVAGAIEAFGPSGFVEERPWVFAGFFAEVFAANPERLAEWKKLIARQDPPSRDWLRHAVQLNRQGGLLFLASYGVGFNDMCCGAFFASGNPAYVRKLAEQLRFVDERRDYLRFKAGATAMLSLARIGEDHPLVRATLKAAQAEYDSRTQDLIGDLLRKYAWEIQQEVQDMDDQINRRYAPATGVGRIEK